ncbi:pyridoxal phosphate-dependent transferase [Suillus lakei]|nr:pyridoxal phosphate-dependent transferase [Suillus lakei]
MADLRQIAPVQRALNNSSYNYLGFSQACGSCSDAVQESIRRYGVSTCGTRLERGSTELHVSAEALVARFLGMDDALGSLIISDELNHTSIRLGARDSGLESGSVQDTSSVEDDLELLLKFYLFVDEAHSIGALGPHGRDVTDYFNIPPRSIDVLMGIFTKSSGAAGGYIAGSEALIDALRPRGHSGPYAEAMPPPVLTQIIASIASMMGVVSAPQPTKSPNSLSPANSIVRLKDSAKVSPRMAPASMLPKWLNLHPSLVDGSEAPMRIRRLAFNSRYLHAGLKKLGFMIDGHPFSPIVPLLMFNPAKLFMFARIMRVRNTDCCRCRGVPRYSVGEGSCAALC